MADEREPPPMEDSNENDDDDIFSEAKEVITIFQMVNIIFSYAFILLRLLKQ